MKRIFVSTYPFGKADRSPISMLESENKFSISYNPLSRKLKAEEVFEFAKEADVIIAGTEDLSLLIHNSKKLRMISRVGIGLDSVDLVKCNKKGIKVCYTPDAVTMAVAEMTIGLMISLTRNLNIADKEIREGAWHRHYGKRIGESTIGIIGFGRVGKNVAKLLQSFSPKILVDDIKDISDEIAILKKNGLKISKASKKEIYSQADIVSLHLPAYSKTFEMISAESLAFFQNSTYLINTARGELINEQDLYECLYQRKIAGAALDVFQNEPYFGPLAQLSNVLLTQHMGSCSYDCRLAMESQAAEDAIRFLNDLPLLREVPESEYQYQ